MVGEVEGAFDVVLGEVEGTLEVVGEVEGTLEVVGEAEGAFEVVREAEGTVEVVSKLEGAFDVTILSNYSPLSRSYIPCKGHCLIMNYQQHQHR